MACCSSLTIGITIAILDFFGGLLGLGTFMFILFESSWEGSSNGDGSALALYCLYYFELLIELHFHKASLFVMVLLFICIILSSLHVAFAPILLFGIVEKRPIFIRLWRIFKYTALTLSTPAFVFFIIEKSIPMIVIYLLFLGINALFLLGIRPLLRKTPRRSIPGFTGRFLLEDAAAPNGILQRFVNLVEEKGVQGWGLYRVSGNQADEDTLFERLGDNPNIDLASFAFLDVQTLASACKELVGKGVTPPIFPSDKLKEVEQIAQLKDPNDRSQEMRRFLLQLPAANFDALKILFTHFAKVAAKSQVNTMSSNSLAVCWWLTLWPINITEKVKLQQLQPLFKNLLKTMIDHNEYFFGVQEAEM